MIKCYVALLCDRTFLFFKHRSFNVKYRFCQTCCNRMSHEGNEEKNWKEVAQELGWQLPNKLKVGQACVCVGQCGIHCQCCALVRNVDIPTSEK